MDARITKQRLANMLSYDWLKIIGVIALAAVFFCMFFMMIATRPTDGQLFYVYAYNSLTAGGDFGRLDRDLENKNVFSYEILDTGSETFSSGGIYGNSVFSARRSVGEGRVMFVSDVRTADENGVESSELIDFIADKGTPSEEFRLFLDPKQFLSNCESYLSNFFGENLAEAEPDADKTRAAFMERNGKDKRFRSSAKKEAGIKQETERLKKLKADFAEVNEAIGSGKLGYITYTGYENKEYVVGFSLASLNISSLVYYTVEEEGVEVKKTDGIALCLFDNGTREGDLKYETVDFLAYLLRTYGAAQ